MADKDTDGDGCVQPKEEGNYGLQSSSSFVHGGADAPSPIVLDEPVKAALQRAAVDPEKLRQYAEDVALHPFLDKVRQEAGAGDIGTRLKTIEALSGAEATPAESIRIGRKVSAVL